MFHASEGALSSDSSRRRTGLTVAALLLLALITAVCLNGFKQAEQLYVAQLRDTQRLQGSSVQSMLDDASALLMETCDNYRLIDVGRSTEPDSWQITERACS